MDRRTLIAIAIACLLGATLTFAAVAAPVDDGMPTPEQVDQVTRTKPIQELETEVPFELDPISIDANRKREIAFRTVELGLSRPRSDRSEDADLTVCRKLQRVGSHITKIYCASNRSWNYIRKVTVRDAFGETAAVGAPYTLYEGPVYELSTNAIAAIGKQYEGDDHAARLAQLTAEESAAKLGDEWNTPAAVVGRFALAFEAVAAIAKQGGGDAEQERRMAAAIAAQGFSVDQYNELVARLETSERFQKRVSYAAQAGR